MLKRWQNESWVLFTYQSSFYFLTGPHYHASENLIRQSYHNTKTDNIINVRTANVWTYTSPSGAYVDPLISNWCVDMLLWDILLNINICNTNMPYNTPCRNEAHKELHNTLYTPSSPLIIHNSLILSCPAQKLLVPQIFPTTDSLPASRLPSRTITTYHFFSAISAFN